MAIHYAYLVESKTTTGAGGAIGPNQWAGLKSFQATVVGSGAVTTTTLIQASNHNTSSVSGDWVTLGTITISGTSVVSDGFVSEAPWKYYRYNVFAVSGTGAAVTVAIGQEQG